MLGCERLEVRVLPGPRDVRACSSRGRALAPCADNDNDTRKGTAMSDIVAIQKRKESAKIAMDREIMPLNRELIKDLRNLDPNKRYAYIPAEDVFKLHATHGLTVDIVRDLAREKGMLIDEVGFNRLMDEHRKVSRPPGKHLGLSGVK